MKAVLVSISDLKPHPRNYRKHPEDQLAHIEASIKKHGFYRNVVATEDRTILAGHGVVQAAQRMGRKKVPVVFVDVDPDDPRAIAILTGDNEIGNLGEVDNLALTNLLKDLVSVDPSELLGTGFDEMMLANLVFVSRPEHEVKNIDAAAEWVGLPEYERHDEDLYKITFVFRSKEERDEFARSIGADGAVSCVKGRNTSYHWPLRKDRHDWASVKFEPADEADEADP